MVVQVFVEDCTCLALCLALWGLWKELKSWFYPKGKRNLRNHHRITPSKVPSHFLLGWAFRDLWLRPKKKHSGRQAWSWVEERTDWGWQRGWGAWELRRDLGRVQDHQESRQRVGWGVHSVLGRRMGQTGSQVAEAGWLSYLSWRNWTGGWARRPQWWPRHEATWWEGKERNSMRARGSKNGQNSILALLQRKEAKVMLRNVEG